MPVNSKLLEVMPEDYGYVIFVAIASNMHNTYLARNVMKARKEFAVEYPDMYSKDSVKFNCIQRAHQCALENHPLFTFLLMVGGLQYPRITAGVGSLYIFSRAMYSRGYSSGDPKNRVKSPIPGVPTPLMPLCLLTLLGNTVSFACHQLRWC